MSIRDSAWVFLDMEDTHANGSKVIEFAREQSGAVGWSMGSEIYLVVEVNEDFNNLTTMYFRLDYSNDGSTYVPTSLNTDLVALAKLKKGYQILNAQLPVLQDAVDARYFKLVWGINGTAPSAGKVSAALLDHPGDMSKGMNDTILERLPATPAAAGLGLVT